MKIENETGSIVYSLHPTQKVIYVFHTAMFRRGFAERNGAQKGFTKLLEIYRRPTTTNDNLYFLGSTRARWEVYDNITTLISDEENFCPEGLNCLKKALIKFAPLPKNMKNALNPTL